jgi:hypothetical protein
VFTVHHSRTLILEEMKLRIRRIQNGLKKLLITIIKAKVPCISINKFKEGKENLKHFEDVGISKTRV